VPVFTKDQISVLFVHIPKTGGSTIERVFKRSGWTIRLRETKRSHSHLLPLRRCSPQHWHAALLEEMFVVDRFDLRFLVTRDPISRFRSEYLMRNHGNPRTEARALDEWAEQMLARYREDPYTLDNHLRPQVEFQLPHAEVYRLEHGLESIVADLNERFDAGLTSEIPRAMASTAVAGVSSSQVQVSPALDATLREFYAEDFRQFGY
jgi:hypothetical protein